MKISTETASVCRLVSHEKAIEYIAKAGFDAFDLTMCEMSNPNSPFCKDDYLKLVRKIKKVADDNGIVCNQSHAPFPTNRPDLRELCKRAIECTAEAGGKICIIHPQNDKSAEENAEMYFDMLPFAKECGVKIATENMWNWEGVYGKSGHATTAACSHHDDFLKHINLVNDNYLVACVDIGHAEMEGLDTSAVQMIKTLGRHVQALHIHDVDLHLDNHQIPFSLNVDYTPIVKALKDISYSGYFTLEACYYLTKELFNEYNLLDGVKNLAASARRLADMFEQM